jgi:uncharacterized lipoprotein
MKKITTIAVATALLGLAACSTENATPEAENAVVATEEAAPAAPAAPADEAVTEEAAVATAVKDAAEGDAEQPK